MARLYFVAAPQVPYTDLELDETLARAKRAFRRGIPIDRIELDDGSILKPPEVRRLIRERGTRIPGRPRRYG
jgi:hypothetical protein